jgi:hypothetical protein
MLRCGVGRLVTLVSYFAGRGTGSEKAADMSATVPVLAVVTLIVLALIARQRAYHLTSTSLMFVTGALAAWFLLSYSILD